MPLEPHGYYRKATGDGREAVTAAIFWLKTRAGWKETQAHQLESEVRYVIGMDEPCLTAEEWIERYAPPPAAIADGSDRQ
jgi:hypothetical protein